MEPARQLCRADVPLIASATATFLFRQFFLTIPDELAEAAKIDGAGPMRFFRDVLLPLSTTNIAACSSSSSSSAGTSTCGRC
jgi:ABC-type glycerol-3-phosphate transport system permease component